ncbi:hypothetical protein DAPPUDRAFT_235368 [Daphnia pulex]|uniref:Uncharacterized protein n=1 Tax=Daphnia pulex TaxID=6669 RepID=E9FYU7_DAPPU|nr:hypothetical protein DAPPUDRAFT_235368 [Daphnia pulex]|eukprot:EFX87713.1 hypothetical protein DAPPUDRAFT_235368 [Daphnia pulex]
MAVPRPVIIFFWILVVPALAESARILAGGVVAARSATNSPTQSSPSAYRTIQEEEDEIPLDVPTTTTTSTTTSLTNGGVFSKETSVESPSHGHNGQGCWTANEITTASAPLASTEDVTDSSVATKENSPVDLPAESSIASSSSKTRDNPLLIRLRQWTDRFGLSPVRPASAEPPENGITSDVPKSPKLLGSRKIVSTSLSRLFSRSPCHKGGGSGQQQQQQSAANLVASKESNHLLFQESSTSGHRLCKNNVTTISSASADVSRSLDNVTTATAAHIMSDSTNHPTQNA